MPIAIPLPQLQIGLANAARESPSTSSFYRLSQIRSKSGDEYLDFRNRVVSLTGVLSP